MSDAMIRLKVVGDICPGDKSILGLGVNSLMRKHGADFPLHYVKDYFKDADIVLGNLEGVLSPSANTSRETFCGIPEFAFALKEIGFSVLTIANNHIMENGVSGFNDTVDAIQAAGISICGLRGSEEFYSQPVFFNIKGLTVGILAYNWVSTDLFKDADDCIAQSRDSVVNYSWHRTPRVDRENRRKINERNCNVISDVKRLRSMVDFLVVVPHWGYEFVHFPPYGTILEAHSFIDAGADAIVGTHPHVIQGVESYKNGVIAYSLGNFIFDSRFTTTKDGVVLDLALGKNVRPNISLYFTRSNNFFQPKPVDAKSRLRLEKLMDSYSQVFGNNTLNDALDDEKLYKKFEKMYNILKWHNIILHFALLPLHPKIALTILKKIGTFVNLVIMKLHGNNVRW
jgi:gamma-polyglutamate biosynthesis protein CapA